MTCKIIQTPEFTAIQCSPSPCYEIGREPKMRLQAGELIGWCDMEPEIFNNLKPTDNVTMYDDGAGIWGDFEGSWTKTFRRKNLTLIENLKGD